jgi:hypothetical protein
MWLSLPEGDHCRILSSETCVVTYRSRNSEFSFKKCVTSSGETSKNKKYIYHYTYCIVFHCDINSSNLLRDIAHFKSGL